MVRKMENQEAKIQEFLQVKGNRQQRRRFKTKSQIEGKSKKFYTTKRRKNGSKTKKNKKTNS